MSDNNDFSNPLTRRTPLGGRTGVAIASLVPLLALLLFFVFGLTGGWSWSWVFFLAIPIAGVIIYGLGARPNR